MRIYTVWVTRRVTHHALGTVRGGDPELIEAWDEGSVGDNPRGWNRAIDRAIDSIGDDLYDSRIIILTVDERDIEATFDAHIVMAGVEEHTDPTAPTEVDNSSVAFTLPPTEETVESDQVTYTTAAPEGAFAPPFSFAELTRELWIRKRSWHPRVRRRN